MFCWGNSTHGELCLGQEDLVIRPTLSKWSESDRIRSVGAGEMHSLYLTLTGRLYSSGSNLNGQLGRNTEDPNDTFPVELLETFKGCAVSTISCGANHSLALDEWGQPFSWGSDVMGQLGTNLGSHLQCQPKIIKTLASKNVIQIACGQNHSFALTQNGELFSWGANAYGQLGHGTTTPKEAAPQQVTSLAGIPIAMIACGYNHTFALSKSGAVFGWGKNSHGQLGFQDTTNRCYPAHLKALRHWKVCHIACGEDFSVFLTLEGGVYTCGSGEYGQTGHGSSKDELAPRRVLELMGSAVTQVACGRRHLLCRVGRRVLVCGYGARGQLGKPHISVALVPTPVDFVPTDDSPFPIELLDNPMKIFAGGDHSFAAVTNDKSGIDFRKPEHNKQILMLTLPKLAACEMFKDSDSVNQEVLAYAETVFGSMECLNGSFLLPDNAHFGCCAKESGVDIKKAEQAFAIISRIENTSLKELIFHKLTDHILNGMKRAPPDAEVLRMFLILPLYHEMRNPRRHPDLQGPFAEVLNRLSSAPQKIVGMWWEAQSTEYFEMLVDIFKSVVVYEIMQPAARENKKITFCPSIIQVLNALAYLNKINFANPKKPKISAECFYIEDLVSYVDIASDYIMWLSDTDSTQPHMCNYSFLFDVQCKSLLLRVDQQLQMHIAVSRATTHIITRLVFDPTYEYHRDQFLQLSVNRNSVVHDTMLQISNNDSSNLKKPLRELNDNDSSNLKKPLRVSCHATTHIITRLVFEYHRDQFLQLTVNRNSVVHDTMLQISNNDSSNLKKPLRVEFVGEEAEDAGGVRKEFFLLLLKELFDPVYGMFQQSEETRMIWFSSNPFEENVMYSLIGAIFGLAIYNSIIIYVPFPLVLYKKILGETVMLDDLSDLYPTLTNSLRSLLQYPDDDVEEVFCLCFAVNTVVFDQVQVHPLKEGGEEMAVTRDNKAEYVELYVDFLLNKSVKQQFDAFNQGFQKVCGGRIIKLFRSHELMSVVIGSEEYDWESFQAGAAYKNGYSASDDQIKWFWEVFHELSLEDKKKFLLFLTGSDRVPIQGMKELRIIIQPVADDRFYPVAHTCFNLLDLPRYRTKERLKYHLLQAIQQTQGFSLV